MVHEVMREDGIVLAVNDKQSVFDLVKRGYKDDVVLSLCSRETDDNCPVFPGKAYRLNWPFSDPCKIEGGNTEKLTAMRNVRGDIRDRVTKFLHYYALNGIGIFTDSPPRDLFVQVSVD